MSRNRTSSPILSRFYRRFLREEDSAAFILEVSQRYTVGTLERLATVGGRTERRGAVLALGFLAADDSSGVLARALRDPDRGVRMLADNGIRAVWCRAGNELQRYELKRIMRLNLSGQHESAVHLASQLVAQAPRFAEAWNQRAIARYHLGQFVDCIDDCTRTLRLKPWHFGAAAGMGQCYLQLGAPVAALENLRRAVRLNPGLEGVRAQIAALQRALKNG